MDLAAIVITASAIIIILQVISIILIVIGKKAVVKPEPAVVIPVINDNRDFRKKRDDNRFNKRPVIDQRERPFTPPQPQAVDHVENSLRDINLKLKNAERDQESARRKIRDVIQNPQNSQQNAPRRFDQNNNRPNRGRGDDFRRQDRDRDRDRDRNSRPQGGQFRDRDQNRGPENIRPQGETVAPVSAPVSAPMPAPFLPPSVEPARPQNPVAVQPVVEKKEPLAIVPENTEVLHGRKVLVRRRILTAEEQALAAKNAVATGAAADSSQPSQLVIGEAAPLKPENAGPAEPSPEPAAPQNTEGTESELQNIKFGR
jgi:hypothetical protein